MPRRRGLREWTHYGVDVQIGCKANIGLDVEDATVTVARRGLEGLDGASVAVQSIHDATLPDEEQPGIAYCIGAVHHFADPGGAA